ncbi:MAG: response regulator transcription factor [Bacteroidetes bacterium]|nr:response regulator transcription factor [Bacteroidota bacterium]MBT5527713.1 response regulator transcription factor [Cytophagia bacterium]MBT3935131.1 response regulator transcription factor [Bacteroidota bacterium]MBT4338615.1 response regulator transcription factor [Bacteroidota bacterium]MBT5989440.1 response regulator transcription factor [Bacteroidota bacterium]
METIKAILVDDEKNSLSTLQLLLDKYCPEVEIIGTAQNVADSIKIIDELKPELVFLDIAMPDGDGFEVLENVSHKLFQVIFTTAYDQYALRAFEYAALHYLLKPINFNDLQDAVARFTKVTDESEFDDKLLKIKDSLASQQNKIILPTMEGLNIIDIEDIIRCESDNNYTIFILKTDKKIVVSKTLSNYEKLLADKDFFRIHSKHLVNLKYVKKYVKGRGGYVVFFDGTHADVSASRVKDFLVRLKIFAKSLN